MRLLVLIIVLCSFAASEDCNEHSRRYNANYFPDVFKGVKFDDGSEVKYKWVYLIFLDTLKCVKSFSLETIKTNHVTKQLYKFKTTI